MEVTSTIKNRHGQEVPHVFQSQYGSLKVASLVGREFGCRVQLSNGWGYVLYPTPELWTLTLPHRTQILYTTDISMVLARLNIGPGSVVCEAGTGSGSLSHAFLRAIGPTGHLHTADFHKERQLTAADEFTRHGVGGRVTTHCRDVCAAGWPVAGVADAAFLDLPRPWDALHHAVNAIKTTGGRICSFSPCIEQVSRSCEVMRQLGLQNVTTLEVLTRELQVKQAEMPVIEISPDDRPNWREMKSSDDCISAKRPEGGSDCGAKRAKLSPKEENEQEEVAKISDAVEVEEEKEETVSTSTLPFPGDVARHPVRNGNKKATKSFLSTYPKVTQAGHTGYLTFCLVPPHLPRPAPPPVNVSQTQ
ncbi:tRNA (1-methyladenosine) methyltransferase catalytic subunit Gcd14 [Trinorchestia longiramus]|nr:tRNA (1-methyladenosine) methyltransferase catalytic subunit Gcd14 [Trinorchestia longiramus]